MGESNRNWTNTQP